MTTRLIIALLVVIGLGAENWWLWNKAKNSCIQNVIAGATTFQKEQGKAAVADIAQAEADTKTITELKEEISALRNKRNRRVQEATTNGQSAAPGSCLSAGALDRVREAAGKTGPG